MDPLSSWGSRYLRTACCLQFELVKDAGEKGGFFVPKDAFRELSKLCGLLLSNELKVSDGVRTDWNATAPTLHCLSGGHPERYTSKYKTSQSSACISVYPGSGKAHNAPWGHLS